MRRMNMRHIIFEVFGGAEANVVALHSKKASTGRMRAIDARRPADRVDGTRSSRTTGPLPEVRARTRVARTNWS
jgi:hypothetical protein